jgi:hypothetical protein
MTCHLFLDNFSWNFVTFGLFSKVKSFWNGFLFQENLKYHNFDIMKCSSFLNLVFRKRHVIAEIWLCFRACNSRIVTCDKRILSCGVILCFNHCYRIFWKVSLKKSWCCRKQVFVFKIVSLKGLNKFWSNYLFPLTVG